MSLGILKPATCSHAHGQIPKTSLSAVINDYWGAQRPQGIAYDVGAHEYSAVTRAAPPILRIDPQSGAQDFKFF